ncbi:actin-like ATPase domain-containing protein [Cucurbitaria berberidis CBS 394.84]|uniref:Actin-like ATPase domain-containing protein n=1 Tax=Cucurbitaria berberidis CBS 394.84 TaxID=1168544 RepID=A0A9P4GGN4_9PLEO|nr:actin-like ATPase domain-containing protein [Cucurbitaria berberidis CBS 394.84]KAF1844825.1 actin-like ATPase domain-containing protein [Cucurbitaria berberidis CBS 394.84]
MTCYSWTKLLLDENARATEFDDPSLKRSEGEGMLKLPPGKSATEVVTDFLREIYDWIESYLARRISAEILDMTPMEFWFTVPAIWSDQAKSATLAAAKAAGFASGDEDRIYLIPEPEAAGIATLKGFSEGNSVARAQAGDGILICDCGGGTVDITSYKVTQMSPQLKFEEIVEGIGGKCGSTYIDREFHQWMSRTFGQRFEILKFEKTGPGSRFMKDFESHKRDFGYSSNLDQIYEINLVIPGAQDSASYDTDESIVKLNGHAMLSFFEPVVTKIIALLSHQIERASQTGGRSTINRVVLVGGFGDSPYLNSRVREWCQQKGLVLTCPEHPQAAIARGAALRGLDSVAPIRRRSRRHYGLVSTDAFREGIDPESSSEIDMWTGDKRCTARMYWAIAKGQVIDEETKIVLRRRRTYTEGQSLDQNSKLFACSSDVAPEYKWDPAIEQVAELKHAVHPSQLGTFDTKVVRGVKHWDLRYDREISMGSKEGTLNFKVFHDGVEWGQSEIQYQTRRGEKRTPARTFGGSGGLLDAVGAAH